MNKIFIYARPCVNKMTCPAGVCKTGTGYLRMADADGKKNADKKKVRGKKTRNADGKKRKK